MLAVPVEDSVVACAVEDSVLAFPVEDSVLAVPVEDSGFHAVVICKLMYLVDVLAVVPRCRG